MSATGSAPAGAPFTWGEDGTKKSVLFSVRKRISGSSRQRLIRKAEQARLTAERPLRVGSWPGPSYQHNAFVAIFCAALNDAGLDVVDVADPRKIDPVAIDILHIHWPEQVFWRELGPTRTIALLLAVLCAIGKLRAHGVTIVWMVHNLRPHGAAGLRAALWRISVAWLRRRVDAFVTLSPATLETVKQTIGFPSKVARTSVRHPHYPLPTALQDRQTARLEARTGDHQRLLVSVGNIKRYKGQEALARAVLQSHDDTALIIAGECIDGELIAVLRAVAEQAEGRIDLRLTRQSDAAFAALVRAADYVVLPFTDYLHSGSIVHALSLGSRVLTPDNPYAADLAAVIGEEWVRTYVGELNPQIITALPKSGGGQPDLGVLAPPLVGRAMADFYENLRATS